MDSVNKMEFLAVSGLVAVLAGIVVVATLLFANAPEIAHTIASIDFSSTTATEGM